MNRSMIRFLLGGVLKIEGLLLLLPIIIALIYRERVGTIFALLAGISFLIGVIFTIRKPDSTVFYLKEGCVTCSLSWILLSLVG